MSSQESVASGQCPSRARVDCIQSSGQSGYINISLRRQSTCAHTRAREEKHASIENPIAYFKAWREKKFGGDFDPPALAVDEAVAAFSSHKSPAAQKADRLMWLKIANRAGYERFLDAFDEKASELNQLNQMGKRLRNPAASFQKLLNKRFPKPQSGEMKNLEGAKK